MKITKKQLQKLIKEEIQKINENKSDQEILNILSRLFTTKLELDDVKHIRYQILKSGGVGLFDNDGELGHIDATAHQQTLDKFGITAEEVINFLKSNGAKIGVY